MILAIFTVIGLSKGTIFGLGNRVLGSTSDPDRLVGIGYFVELSLPAVLIILYATWIIPTWGHIGVLVALGLLLLVLGAITTPFLPENARAATVNHELPKAELTSDIVYGLLSSLTLFLGAAGM